MKVDCLVCCQQHTVDRHGSRAAFASDVLCASEKSDKLSANASGKGSCYMLTCYGNDNSNEDHFSRRYLQAACSFSATVQITIVPVFYAEWYTTVQSAQD